MTIEQLKKWCKEQAEYYEGEMDMSTESYEEEYYKCRRTQKVGVGLWQS